ncbi:MAG: chorismate synthase, partial [Clostridiales bacterium]
ELFRQIAERQFPVIDEEAGQKMAIAIKQAAEDLDSLGGMIEAAVIGLPAGLGGPLFGGLESRLAAALFAVPAVKGLDFGAGFAVAAM